MEFYNGSEQSCYLCLFSSPSPKTKTKPKTQQSFHQNWARPRPWWQVLLPSTCTAHDAIRTFSFCVLTHSLYSFKSWNMHPEVVFHNKIVLIPSYSGILCFSLAFQSASKFYQKVYLLKLNYTQAAVMLLVIAGSQGVMFSTEIFLYSLPVQ